MSGDPAPDWRPCAEEPAQGATQPKRPTWRALLDAVRTNPRVLALVAGLLVYAVLRVAYVSFYQPFGLSPDDLGFGYLDLLAQAAVGTVALTLVLGALVSIWVLLAAGGVLWWAERRRSRPAKAAAAPDEPAKPGAADAARLSAAEVAVIVVSLLLTAAVAVAGLAVVVAVIGEDAVAAASGVGASR